MIVCVVVVGVVCGRGGGGGGGGLCGCVGCGVGGGQGSLDDVLAARACVDAVLHARSDSPRDKSAVRVTADAAEFPAFKCYRMRTSLKRLKGLVYETAQRTIPVGPAVGPAAAYAVGPEGKGLREVEPSPCEVEPAPSGGGGGESNSIAEKLNGQAGNLSL